MKFNRHTFPFLGVALFAALLFLFRLPVSKLLDAIIVRPLFISFERGIWADIILLLLLLISVIWIAKEQQRKLLFRLTLFGLVFYGFQRTNNYWSFIFMTLFPRFAYWDLVALVMTLALPLNFLLRRKAADNEVIIDNQGFIEDNAVTQLEDDHFNRKTAAAEIARIIQLTKNRKSFAIGILGEYGSGKTSFLNLINLELSSEEVLKIAFNPWTTGKPETIRREFFDLLAREVAEFDLTISSLVYSYGRKLASFDARSLNWMNWLAFFRNRGSVQSSGEHEQINKMLHGLHRKIVITIDDLDRLYPSEVMEVLKLIRNTADFSNVFYLVAYDKAYIHEALKTISELGGQNYLDKIFQLEIPLPKREADDLLTILQDRIKEMVSPEHYSAFENIMIQNDFRRSYEKAYNSILRQGRDVVRFLNSFRIVYRLIGEEVDFECLVILELIKFRFPSIYELIYTQRDLFLSENPVRSTHEQYLSPRMIKNEDADKRLNETSFFKKHIEQFKWLTVEDTSVLDGLFMSLFKVSTHSKTKKINLISYPLYFEIYFRYRLSKKDISDKEFKAAMEAGQMAEYMAYCANHGLHKELMVRLMQENISENRHHFEQVISWIFSFGRTFVEKEGKFRFDYGALVDKIYNYHNHITDKVYKKDISTYKDFITNLLSMAMPPFLFENELIYHLKKKGDNFVIPTSELTTNQLSYFTKMADSGHGLSEETLWLFWGAREYYRIPANEPGTYYEKWRFEPSLVDKMKIYLINKDPKEFLKASIQHEMRDHSLVFITREIIEIFDDPSEYRTLVAQNPLLDDAIRQEYLQLFDKLAEKDFMEYVVVELKTELLKRGLG
ncbi:KAP family P-loop NTPase fold protein [Chitinophaga parva]|uniref:KAP family P-loop NTPase fold protein n=1 Tax=Chitinophaga parva TaxID=2169414 RepID=UPI00105744B4|nr:P-loop NTPase fold protein [Chitinophaga parva]